VSYQLIQGDCLQVLRTLPENSVQCCVTSPPYFGLRAYLSNGHEDKSLEIGLEETPECYVAKLVAVFREVRRVLHPSGVIWVNLGDSYNGSAPNRTGENGYNDGRVNRDKRFSVGGVRGLKPKDLIGIPWMVAFALRADGWWLRSEIIWHKRAPMPESVTDRPTKAHEQVFLLAKSATYYYDAEAIKEAAKPEHLSRYKYGFWGDGTKEGSGNGRPDGASNTGGHKDPLLTRNKRSVWTLGPESYDGAHFAVMPTKLVEPCILAGSSARGACAKCGAPWERVVEREAERYNEREGIAQRIRNQGATNGGTERVTLGVTEHVKRTTTGWQPTCTCNCADVVPCTVLDCFSGSGTTLAVALKHHRHAIGIELNPDYLELARTRIERTQPTLLEVTP
jgi:DNA modification methylase